MRAGTHERRFPHQSPKSLAGRRNSNISKIQIRRGFRASTAIKASTAITASTAIKARETTLTSHTYQGVCPRWAETDRLRVRFVKLRHIYLLDSFLLHLYTKWHSRQCYPIHIPYYRPIRVKQSYGLPPAEISRCILVWLLHGEVPRAEGGLWSQVFGAWSDNIRLCDWEYGRNCLNTKAISTSWPKI